jgi:hypothetical protein
MTITAAAPRASAYRGRLRWWTELPLIAVMYALYSGARLLVRGDVDDAVEHGADILHFEQILHLDPERWFNTLFTDHAFLGVPADFAYASLHYIITPSILVWLWRRRPTHYRVARTWLLISTLIGLAGFTLVPTAPPRLLGSGHGFMDTMSQYGNYGWWGTDASAPRGMGHLTNEYAAMPSLHVGWSLWCGIQLWRYGRSPLLRALGILYPVTTAIVVMGTANHYLMDAAAGVAVMGLGYVLARPSLRVVDALHLRVKGPRAASAAMVAAGAAATPEAVSGPVCGPAPASGAPGASGGTSGKGSSDGTGAGAPVPGATAAPSAQRPVTVPAQPVGPRQGGRSGGAEPPAGDGGHGGGTPARGEHAARGRLS